MPVYVCEMRTTAFASQTWKDTSTRWIPSRESLATAPCICGHQPVANKGAESKHSTPAGASTRVRAGHKRTPPFHALSGPGSSPL